MIAENRRGRGAERLHGAQDRQRIGAAVDEIADDPKAVARAIERDHVEKLREFGVAALNVADNVMTHGA